MTEISSDGRGYVYILVSPKSEFIKIGGTDFPPMKRIKEINLSEPYRSHGPWALSDFRQVTNWRKVESFLHYTFRSKLNKSIEGQKELFQVSSFEASKLLEELDPSEVIKKPKIDRMFQDHDLSKYLIALFKFTGMMNWLDIQGAWTFVLFPSTNGGRYFTLNIGPHEVAFSTLPKKDEDAVHFVLMDRLILDFENVATWLKAHQGEIKLDSYQKALPRSTSIMFRGSFGEANEFLKLEGIRRALIAYWNESLVGLKERNSLSLYAKYHNWNAIAEIHKRIELEY